MKGHRLIYCDVWLYVYVDDRLLYNRTFLFAEFHGL